ncbi:hypothetical protein C8J57DRAFT_1210239 [Mycena rebaudengoi]|nr:hypothetical protein C8J57DRAFT_1210239 [Mycena rebaudengoi]
MTAREGRKGRGGYIGMAWRGAAVDCMMFRLGALAREGACGRGGKGRTGMDGRREERADEEEGGFNSGHGMEEGKRVCICRKGRGKRGKGRASEYVYVWVERGRQEGGRWSGVDSDNLGAKGTSGQQRIESESKWGKRQKEACTYPDDTEICHVEMRDPETSASNLSKCDVRQKIGVNKCRWLLRPQAKCTSGQSTSPQRSAWQLHQNWTLVDDRVDNFLGRYRIEGAVHALQLVPHGIINKLGRQRDPEQRDDSEENTFLGYMTAVIFSRLRAPDPRLHSF